MNYSMFYLRNVTKFSHTIIFLFQNYFAWGWSHIFLLFITKQFVHQNSILLINSLCSFRHK